MHGRAGRSRAGNPCISIICCRSRCCGIMTGRRPSVFEDFRVFSGLKFDNFRYSPLSSLLTFRGRRDLTSSVEDLMAFRRTSFFFSLISDEIRHSPASGLIPLSMDKKDKVPSLACIESCRPVIVHYWRLLREAYPKRFDREISLALTGAAISGSSEEVAFLRLKEKCRYLIEMRGYEKWEG